MSILVKTKCEVCKDEIISYQRFPNGIKRKKCDQCIAKSAADKKREKNNAKTR